MNKPSCPQLTRRQTLGLAGAAGAALLVGGRAGSSTVDGLIGSSTEAAGAATPACVLTPALTEGPYYVEENLLRSDVRTDPANGNAVSPGVALALTLDVVAVNDSGCAPVAGVIVDIWHCDASGAYSDVAQNGTSGKKFLRGSQISDSNGQVKFTTIFPGWYQGRAVHIHFKVRAYAGSNKVYEFTSQLFFDTAQTNAILAGNAPYSSRGTPSTSNAQDGIYDASTQIALSANGSGGYKGGLVIGLGSSAASGGDGSVPDDAAAAALKSATWSRTRTGQRVLKLKLNVDEKVAADARILRGGTTLRRYKPGKRLAPGTRTLKIKLGRRVGGGAARLKLTLKDGAGNVKTIRRKLRVPKR